MDPAIDLCRKADSFLGKESIDSSPSSSALTFIVNFSRWSELEAKFTYPSNETLVPVFDASNPIDKNIEARSKAIEDIKLRINAELKNQIESRNKASNITLSEADLVKTVSDRFETVRSQVNPFEGLDNSIFFNRAPMKLASLDASFGVGPDRFTWTKKQ